MICGSLPGLCPFRWSIRGCTHPRRWNAEFSMRPRHLSVPADVCRCVASSELLEGQHQPYRSKGFYIEATCDSFALPTLPGRLLCGAKIPAPQSVSASRGAERGERVPVAPAPSAPMMALLECLIQP